MLQLDHGVWRDERSFPFLNHFRAIFLGKKLEDMQLKFTDCPIRDLSKGHITTGRECGATKRKNDKQLVLMGQAVLYVL